MASLGPYLRELRERRGLSLEEMVRATRVAARYLEALEADDFRALPAPAFTKGFIRAWCQVAGADPSEALARYQKATGEPVAVPLHQIMASGDREVPRKPPNRGPVLVSFVLLVVLGLALFGVTLGLQSGRDRADRLAVAEPPPSAGAPSASAPDVPPGSAGGTEGGVVTARESQVVTRAAPPPAATRPIAPPASASPGASTATPASSAAASASPSTSPSPSMAQPSPAAAPPSSAPGESIAATVGAVTSPYRLVARVSEPTWIRVRMEDGRTTEETIPPNEVREWVSNGAFVLTIGNAGGVSFELNGRPVPRLGASGAVISRMVLPAELR